MLTLRPATQDDSRTLYKWRNDWLTRANSINTEIVPWEGHTKWFAASLANPARQLMIAEVDGVAVGMVRIDDGEELSWTVGPEFRGKGYAKEMVSAAAFPGAIAKIKAGNIASQKVAAAAGFTLNKDGPLQSWRCQ